MGIFFFLFNHFWSISDGGYVFKGFVGVIRHLCSRDNFAEANMRTTTLGCFILYIKARKHFWVVTKAAWAVAKYSSLIGNFISVYPTMFWILKSLNWIFIPHFSMILMYFLAAILDWSSLLAPVQIIFPLANIKSVGLGSLILMITAGKRVGLYSASRACRAIIAFKSNLQSLRLYSVGSVDEYSQMSSHPTQTLPFLPAISIFSFRNQPPWPLNS